MSAPQKNHSNSGLSCLISGEWSFVSKNLNVSLGKKGCNVYVLENNLFPEKDKIIPEEKRIAFDEKKTNAIPDFKYVFHLIPRKISSNKTAHKVRNNELLRVIDLCKDTNAKLTVISPVSAEYALLPDEILEKYFKINRKDITKHKQFISEQAKLIKSSGVDWRIVQGIDILGEGIERDTPINAEVIFANLPKSVELINQGEILLRPTNIKDFIEQVIKTSFTQHSSNKIFQIEGKQTIPQINIAYAIKNHLIQSKYTSPQTNINKTETKKESNEGIKIYLSSQLSINQIVTNTTDWCIRNKKNVTRRPVLKPKSPKAPTQKNRPKKPFKKIRKNKNSNIVKIAAHFVIASIFFMAILPIIYIKSNINAIKHFKEGSFQESKKHSSIAIKTHKPTEVIIKPLLPLGTMFTGAKKEDLLKLLKTSNTSMNALKDVSDLAETSERLLLKILNKEKGDVSREIELLSKTSLKIYNSLSEIEASLNNLETTNIKPQYNQQISQFTKIVREGRLSLREAQKILSIFKELVGVGGQKTYLLLLQNNAELRATGGFIGSFALVSFDQGKLLDIETYDVYSADGQLRGHVEPPQALKKYLGEANWYLRDSNWDPNFPTTARRAEWFLDKEMSRQVDGTIGINLNTVQDILGVVGGIELADYQENITSENLFQRAEYHSELNYFEGSTQKKDFIASLINSLYLKLEEISQDGGVEIAKSIFRQADQSQILFSLRDPKLESVIQDTIFSGKIKSPTCAQYSQENCINDYLSIIESNVGVNKTNYFINRSLSHSVEIQKGRLLERSTLTISNTAQSAAWPAGTYKNYIRFIIPQNSSIKEILVDNKKVDPREIQIESKYNKKIVGFYFEVPVKSQATAQVAYQLNKKIPNDSSFSYQMYFQKQSGTTNDPLFFEVSAPTFMPLEVSSGGEIVEKKATLSTTNEKSQKFSTEFAK
ncbi:DUF4012 domain-containing protein [Patescibacteria group bacterium]